MSGLPRWKENRIRQEIPLAHLKHPKSSANGAGAHGAYPLGWNGTSVRSQIRNLPLASEPVLITNPQPVVKRSLERRTWKSCRSGNGGSW